MDWLAGTPNTALWVTSLTIRLWPPRWPEHGDDGGVWDWPSAAWGERGGERVRSRERERETEGGRDEETERGTGREREKKERTISLYHIENKKKNC